ncbi:MAG: PAS domain S-box protein [Magnetococcales bacterium]|nr:PAS domain S-box protein [Magnetococcales bacterium]
MTLQQHLSLAIMAVFIVSFLGLEILTYQDIKKESVQDTLHLAEQIHDILMSTRRVYNQQFLNSGIPLTHKTLGFIPAHALSRISNDFAHWNDSGLYFNNVSDRPRNPDNRADEVEMEAIRHFREHPKEKQRFVEFQQNGKEPFFHYASPIRIEASCLKCHGDQADAPPTIRDTYEASYDYKVGDLRGILSIKLPASAIEQRIQNRFLQESLIHLITLFFVFLLQWYIIKRLVTDQIATLNKGMNAIATGDYEQRMIGLKGDFAQMGHTFNTMSAEIIRSHTVLKENEKRFRSILNNTQSVIFIKDLEGRYLLVNRRFEEWFHVTEDEARGQTDSDLFPTHVSRIFLENERKVLQDFQAMEVEERFEYNGREHTFFSIRFPLRDEYETVYGICCIATDISERKAVEEDLHQAHETLKQRESRLRAILDNALDAIMTTDGNGRIIEFNPAAEQLFGYAEQEVVGQDLATLIIPAKPQHEVPPTQHNAEINLFPEIKLRREIPGKRADGVIIDLEMSLIAIHHNGQTGYTAFLHDITDRKQLLKSLDDTLAVAEAANRSKDEFLANMSHEIRSPMNTILGMTGLVLDTELTIEQRENLEIVRHSSTNLLRIINDILDLSKMEANKLVLERIAFNLQDCVEQVCEGLAVRAHQKNIELYDDLEQDLPLLMGDPLRLNQILTNLVNNAIKFTFKGEIVIRVERIDAPEAGDAEPCFHFSIADTGIGIPSHRIAAIFERFIQMDGSTTRHHGGSGLGLTIVKHLVELMNGSIWAESVEGNGSIFHFTARFGRHSPGPDETRPAFPRTHWTGVRILVGDRHATGRRLIKNMVARWGAEVTEAEDSTTFLAALHHATATGQPFDILLLDHSLSLPGFEETPSREPLSDEDANIARKSKIGLFLRAYGLDGPFPMEQYGAGHTPLMDACRGKIIRLVPVHVWAKEQKFETQFRKTILLKKPVKSSTLFQQIEHALGRIVHDRS